MNYKATIQVLNSKGLIAKSLTVFSITEDKAREGAKQIMNDNPYFHTMAHKGYNFNLTVTKL